MRWIMSAQGCARSNDLDLATPRTDKTCPRHPGWSEESTGKVQLAFNMKKLTHLRAVWRLKRASEGRAVTRQHPRRAPADPPVEHGWHGPRPTCRLPLWLSNDSNGRPEEPSPNSGEVIQLPQVQTAAGRQALASLAPGELVTTVWTCRRRSRSRSSASAAAAGRSLSARAGPPLPSAACGSPAAREAGSVNRFLGDCCWRGC